MSKHPLGELRPPREGPLPEPLQALAVAFFKRPRAGERRQSLNVHIQTTICLFMRCSRCAIGIDISDISWSLIPGGKRVTAAR